jgi:hypothetical protein
MAGGEGSMLMASSCERGRTHEELTCLKEKEKKKKKKTLKGRNTSQIDTE